MNKALILVLMAIDYIWLKSSFGKLSEGKFIGGMSATLTKFASNNPYSFVKDFLQTVAIPNAQTFGYFTMWGETLVAISLFFSTIFLFFNAKRNKMVVYLLASALFGGMFLNLVFWLSSGWSSPSAESLNLLMLLIQTVGFIYAIKIIKER